MSIQVFAADTSRTQVIQFNNLKSRNPLSSEVLHDLEQTINNLRSKPYVATLVFTGTENVFASGANLREIAALDTPTAPAFAARGQSLMNTIAGLRITTIAAINGYCFGGALDLALACDIRIASPEAGFAHPGAGLGIVTGWGGTQRLPRLIGRCNALEMFFTAEPISAGRALGIGLVDLIADDIFKNELLNLDRCQFEDL